MQASKYNKRAGKETTVIRVVPTVSKGNYLLLTKDSNGELLYKIQDTRRATQTIDKLLKGMYKVSNHSLPVINILRKKAGEHLLVDASDINGDLF